jgi:hypothetical protein
MWLGGSANRKPAMTPAGYSGTPLAKKLGIVENTRVLVKRAPGDYRRLLAPVPAGVTFATRIARAVDVVHVFTTRRAELATDLASLRRTLRPDASVWVSWPKKASKVPSDVSEDVIRAVALPLGFVDVKVCAVSDVWSGLKLVVRKELR